MNSQLSATRIDGNVLLTMLIITMLSGLLFAFRMATNKDCVPVRFLHYPETPMAGMAASFNAESRPKDLLTWNFGDGSEPEKSGKTISHIYKKAGRYTISVSNNGGCVELQTILVEEAPITSDGQASLFDAKDTAFVNEAIEFMDTTSSAKTWEWKFEKKGEFVKGNAREVYSYPSPGRKEISLRINGEKVSRRYIDVIEREVRKAEINEPSFAPRKKSGHQLVYVNSAPTEQPLKPKASATEPAIARQTEPKQEEKEKPKEEAPASKYKADQLTKQQIAEMLVGVNKGTHKLADFQFYFCPDMLVNFNDKTMSAAEMVEALKKIKKGKIKKIEVFQRPGPSNCLDFLEVTVKKSGILNNIF